MQNVSRTMLVLGKQNIYLKQIALQDLNQAQLFQKYQTFVCGL